MEHFLPSGLTVSQTYTYERRKKQAMKKTSTQLRLKSGENLTRAEEIHHHHEILSKKNGHREEEPPNNSPSTFFTEEQRAKMRADSRSASSSPPTPPSPLPISMGPGERKYSFTPSPTPSLPFSHLEEYSSPENSPLLHQRSEEQPKESYAVCLDELLMRYLHLQSGMADAMLLLLLFLVPMKACFLLRV